MKMENVELMKQARETLKGKWGLAVGVCFLFLLVIMVIGGIPKIGGLFSVLISGPMMVGLATFSLSLSRKQDASVSQLFTGFVNFWRSFLGYILVIVFIFLWSLLLIVPGIIAAISYSQTFLILADDGSISARNAIKKSKLIMDGNKKKFFFLGFRFLGWLLLSVLTFGIGFFWVMPYMQVTLAKFYDDISAKHNS